MDFKNSWTGKIVRYIIIISISIIAVLFLIMKWVLPDFQKKITNQTAGTIINTTVLAEKRGQLFNLGGDTAWDWIGFNVRLGKPVREKLNGEQNK